MNEIRLAELYNGNINIVPESAENPVNIVLCLLSLSETQSLGSVMLRNLK